MQVSERLVEYLKDVNFPNLNSNFIMSDLNQVLYATTNNDDYYWHKPISKDIKNLIGDWKDKPFSEDLFVILNTDLKQIIENDTTTYSAQMIFPIFIDGKLDGLTIFFRTRGDYILSSSKAPKTITHFIQKHLNDENEK